MGLVAVVAAAAAILFWLGTRSALGGLHVVDVTPAQLSTAMGADEFYSAYNETTLVVHGTAVEVSVSGGMTTVTLSPGVKCAANAGSAVKSGKAVVVVAEGVNAERENYGVLLAGCEVMSPGGS
ncbi:MAG: hypothetical protein JOZ75_09985 [Candidatus Dormibacteraeota bacterium]|nr:hypothetical protein [Candidatus Dormibacteraeota bacterium]